MLFVKSTQKESCQFNDLLRVNVDDLNLCPQAATDADFLQTMDGWL